MSTNVIAIRPKGISSGLSEDIGCPDELSNGIAVVFRSGNNCMFDPARFGLNMKHGISHPLPHSALTAGSSKKKEGSSKNKEADDVKENLVTLVDSYADMSSACDVFFSHVMKARGWESDLRMYPVKKRSLIESCDSDRLGHYVLEPSPKRVKDYSSALVQAVGSANMEQLKLFCENGKSMDACNAHGESIIHISCRRGHLNVLMFLIENGGSAFVLDDFGRSPMHDACWCCNFEESSLQLVTYWT